MIPDVNNNYFVQQRNNVYGDNAYLESPPPSATPPPKTPPTYAPSHLAPRSLACIWGHVICGEHIQTWWDILQSYYDAFERAHNNVSRVNTVTASHNEQWSGRWNNNGLLNESPEVIMTSTLNASTINSSDMDCDYMHMQVATQSNEEETHNNISGLLPEFRNGGNQTEFHAESSHPRELKAQSAGVKPTYIPAVRAHPTGMIRRGAAAKKEAAAKKASAATAKRKGVLSGRARKQTAPGTNLISANPAELIREDLAAAPLNQISVGIPKEVKMLKPQTGPHVKRQWTRWK